MYLQAIWQSEHPAVVARDSAEQPAQMSDKAVDALAVFAGKERLHDMISLDVYARLAMTCHKIHRCSKKHLTRYAALVQSYMEWQMENEINDEPMLGLDLCVICNEHEALDFLGGTECWECYNEH